MRDLTELTDVEEPAWPLLSEAISNSRVSMDVLPVDPALARGSLLQLQASARSSLSSFVLNCGGVLLDSGWLRIYGSPRRRLASGDAELRRGQRLPRAVRPGVAAGGRARHRP